ncbi:MAG: M1 family metallopeptidase [Thermoleophilia bacterium]
MTGRRARIGIVGAVALLGAGGGGAAAAGPPVAPTPVAPTPGAPGLGDPFFPLAGNGGYDVSHYRLDLAYDPAATRLDGSAVIQARATQALSRFDLDLRPFLAVSAVTVDGRPAVVARDGQELVITPARPLRAGGAFTVAVRYGGTPEPVVDPDGSIEGFVPTADGAFVVGEPQGSPGWFPANDNPRDKATYDISVTVPAGLTAMSNGRLVATRKGNGRTTWMWREDDPMATYLATATLGNFSLSISKVDGIPSYVAVDPTQAAASAPVLAKLPAMVRYFRGVFGPYPFDAVGAIVDDAPDVGYALESQTKPNFDRAPDEATLAHELVHQWYGDSVTLTTWPDIWLNEGFATYGEWLWGAHAGGPTTQARFDALYAAPADDAFWTLPPADPGDAADLFAGPVYDRGAMTLQALRVKVGDPAFSAILRRWYAENRSGNVTTAGFVALAERVSRRDLDAFFHTWLYQPAKPTTW